MAATMALRMQVTLNDHDASCVVQHFFYTQRLIWWRAGIGVASLTASWFESAA